MTHIYTQFGEAALPLHRQRYQHDPAAALPATQRIVDGYYDIYGTGAADPALQVIPLTGLYIGEVEYLVDETGDIIVDETGDPIIVGEGWDMLRSQVDALKELTRTLAPLWRARVNDTTVLDWKTARLMSLRYPAQYGQLHIAEVTATFETVMTNWHAEEATVYSESIVDGEPLYLFVENDGMQVDDAVATIAHVSGTITAITIECTALGIDIEWTGTLSTDETLTIDASGDAPPEDSEDAYDGFEFGADHTQQGWLPIPRGEHLFVVTVTGGTVLFTLQFYRQEP